MRYVLTTNPRSATHYLKFLLSEGLGAAPLERRLSHEETGTLDKLAFALDVHAPSRLIYDHFCFSTDGKIISHSRHPDCKLIVLNRHPIDRLISQIAYDQALNRIDTDISYRELTRKLLLAQGGVVVNGTRIDDYPARHKADLRERVLLWLENRECLYIKYEDLVTKPMEVLRLAYQHFGLSKTEEEISAALEKFRFETLSGGRRRGELDPKSHFRAGVAGEWREIFSESDLTEIRDRYGPLYAGMGYPI